MSTLKDRFDYKYNNVPTKISYMDDADYQECVFKVNFFGIPVREKFIINNNYLVVSSEWKIDKPISIPVRLDNGIFKFQFELDGYSYYEAKDRNIGIPKGHFNLFFLPVVDGILHYKQNRKVFEVMFDRAAFLTVFEADYHLFKEFGEAVKANQPAVLFRESLKITSEMNKIFYNIFNCTLHNNLKTSYIENKIKELLLLSFNYSDLYQDHEKVNTNLADDEKLMLIKNWIDKDVLKNALMGDIAKKFGINEFKLKKGFSKHYQTPIMTYIKQVQLKKAYELLSLGKYTVNEVAELLNYQHPQHFTTAFKKAFNKTPSSLLKQL